MKSSASLRLRRSFRRNCGKMSLQGGDHGVLKTAVGLQIPVGLLSRKLIRTSAVAPKTRSNNRTRVAIRQERRIHVDPNGPTGPFHPLISCFFRGIAQEFVFLQVPGKCPGIFANLVSANFPLFGSCTGLQVFLDIQRRKSQFNASSSSLKSPFLRTLLPVFLLV